MKGIILGVLCVCAVSVFAQVDSVTVVNAYRYVGVLYTGSFQQGGNITHDATLRFGGEATVALDSEIGLTGLAGYETGVAGKGIAFGKINLGWQTPIVMIKAGYMPRPITLAMRPAPFTPNGQFEPPALSAMPGGGLGFSMKREISHNLGHFTVGMFYLTPSRLIEWNAAYGVNANPFEFNVAGFASEARKGIAVKASAWKSSCTVFSTSDSVFTGLLAIGTSIVDPYLNANYHRSARKFDKLEVGWTKTYALSSINALMLIGMGYQHHTRGVNAYVRMSF